MMKNIAVLVSGGGTNLQALIAAQNRGEIIGGKITLVVSSNPDAYALKRAENITSQLKFAKRKIIKTELNILLRSGIFSLKQKRI